MTRAVWRTDCLQGAQVQAGERVLRAGIAKEDFPEEEGLGLDSGDSRNGTQNRGENCTTHRVNSNVNYGLSLVLVPVLVHQL